jgi:uncharacterized protein
MKHLINWIEIPVTDMKRAIGFYSKILGVELQSVEMGAVTYAIFPSENQYNNGALAKGAHYKPSADGIVIYLDGGKDLDNILSKVSAAGGELMMQKMFLAKEAGYIGMFIDSEGNKIGIQNM